jgi:hypothetical protein
VGKIKAILTRGAGQGRIIQGNKRMRIRSAQPHQAEHGKRFEKTSHHEHRAHSCCHFSAPHVNRRLARAKRPVNHDQWRAATSQQAFLMCL